MARKSLLKAHAAGVGKRKLRKNPARRKKVTAAHKIAVQINWAGGAWVTIGHFDDSPAGHVKARAFGERVRPHMAAHVKIRAVKA